MLGIFIVSSLPVSFPMSRFTVILAKVLSFKHLLLVSCIDLGEVVDVVKPVGMRA